MGFRFRKSIKLLPGVRLNIGSKRSSVSVGGRGATLNVSKKGTRTTVGIPGSGISYSKYSRHSKNTTQSKGGAGLWLAMILLGMLIIAALN